MKKIFVTLLLALALIFTVNLSTATSQTITFSEKITTSGYQTGIYSEWNCYNYNGCYFWAKAVFSRVISYDYITWSIYKYKYTRAYDDALDNPDDWQFYDEVRQYNTAGTFDWAAKQLTFYDPGYYLIGVFSPSGKLLARGICKWNF